MPWWKKDGLAGALVAAARESSRTDAFIQAAGRALLDSPLKASRVFVSMRALHPVFRARTYLWNADTDHVRVVEWPHRLENRPGYYDSPDHQVHRTGTELRIRHLEKQAAHVCDLYDTLCSEGYNDYLIVPLRFGDGTINTLSIATKEPRGFRDRHLVRFREAVALFAITFERNAALETLDAALNAYLGSGVGAHILAGHIQTGDGELVDAAILMADLNDFTCHAACLDPAATVHLLNDYFDCLVGPIQLNGGQVLKFIGDAVLAFFPVVAAGAPRAPLTAVRTIRQRLAALNQVRAGAGDTPLRHALCLHYGRVLYGNIGSTERLDFTIIGEAVNLAARGVEAAKALDAEYLCTGAFVDRFGATGLIPVGVHALRGVPEPVEMFMLAADPAV